MSEIPAPPRGRRGPPRPPIGAPAPIPATAYRPGVADAATRSHHTGATNGYISGVTIQTNGTRAWSSASCSGS